MAVLFLTPHVATNMWPVHSDLQTQPSCIFNPSMKADHSAYSGPMTVLEHHTLKTLVRMLPALL